MQCKCGHSFSDEELRNIRSDMTSPGYGLIANEEYIRVMELESRCLQSFSEDERLSLISETADFVGSARICPQCGLLMIAWPISQAGNEGPKFYRLVD